MSIRFYMVVVSCLLSLQIQAKNLFETLTGQDVNQIDVLKKHGFSAGGWLSIGGTYNTHNPNNHNNAPIAFNDRSSEFQFNQIDFFLQKAIDQDEHHWSFGGKVDVMFGTDSRFTQATGLDNKLISEQDLRFYDIAIPQAYVEVFAPIGQGLTAKFGHFYTIIGQEVVTSPTNFFYSHAYVMQYAEPFTHTGALFTYTINDNFTVNAGAVTGWDNFDKNLSNWNFLGSISWANDDATNSIAWSLVSGDVDKTTNNNRSLSSLVISHSFTDKLRYVFQNDVGFQEQSTANKATAYWYGINQYLLYDISDTVSVGLRGEWFKDKNGARLSFNSPSDYFACTFSVNWQPTEWLKLRPEIRYDWVDSQRNVYNNRTQKQQLEIAMDAVIVF